MPATFRIIDTGVREGRANIAFDAALIEERQAGRVPDTIRFLGGHRAAFFLMPGQAKRMANWLEETLD